MNTGQIIKSKTNRWTVVPNELLQNDNISWKAKGLMAYLLSLPDDWVLHKSELHRHATDGTDSTRTAFAELEELGYILSVIIRDSDGHFKGYNYMVYSEPHKNEILPISDFPISVSSTSEKPTLQSTNNTKETITKEPNTYFEDFWNNYPKRKMKGDAEKAWNKLSPDSELCNRINLAVSKLKLTPQWLKDDGQYIPYPATWIRAKGWEDDIEPTKNTPQSRQINTFINDEKQLMVK